ncbi:MAG: nicotinate-nucleotide adenylyltransferase [Acidimicrobiales bacterium]|jgi:nicotinate-nucleotide adenylyltransferase
MDRPSATSQGREPNFERREHRGTRIGLLGGTFDPPHLGHLLVAHQIRLLLGLYEVRLVVANEPWQKTAGRVITPAPVRLAMTRAAIKWAEAQGVEGLAASDIELELGGSSFTAVTLDHLNATEPDNDWSVIVGSDAAAGLLTWHEAARLKLLANFVVVDRAGVDAPPPPEGFSYQRVEAKTIDVSSSAVRSMVAKGLSPVLLVPPPVIAIVNEQGLYRPES